LDDSTHSSRQKKAAGPEVDPGNRSTFCKTSAGRQKQGRLQMVPDKHPIAGELASGAKALIDLMGFSGTTEVVPFHRT